MKTNAIQKKLITAVIALFLAMPCTFADSRATVTRTLPSMASPAESFTVTLYMDVNESNRPSVVGLTEYYPAGWVVSSISSGGSDKIGSIDWLFWAYGSPVADTTITYVISAPAAAGGEYEFNGTVLYGTGNTFPVVGDTIIPVIQRSVNVTRDLPDSGYGGTNVTVTLKMDVDESNKPAAVGITEYVPAGWNVYAISCGGIYSALQDKIEWLFANITNPVQDRNITYAAGIPSDASGTVSFSGTVDFGASALPSIGGDTQMQVSQGCPLEGDVPPCGEIKVAEIVTLINEWSSGQKSLSDVIALILAWAAGGQ